MAEDESQPLSRPRRRLLRRIFNGRTVPIAADGKLFLTYKEASAHLQSLAPEAQDAAYAELKSNGMTVFPTDE